MSNTEYTRCLVVAEIGVNHSGDVELAKKMVRAAKAAGADSVKFQTFSAESLVTHGTPKVRYQQVTTREEETHFDMIKGLEFAREDHLPVLKYCRQLGIDFISTPYDVDSAEFLVGLGLNTIKTASADIVDLPLHQYLAKTGLKIIVSTGMATLGEIERVLSIYRQYNKSQVTLLHCVSNYPCAYES